MKVSQNHWTEIIKPRSNLLDLRLKEVWQYRDLLFLLVKRDFVTYYKQTILGPIWFFLQPILTTAIFVIVFGNFAKIGTDDIPMIIFYLSGITLWNYFADCLNHTATVFKDNAALFGKVYFPRLIMPLSIIISNLIKLSIQLLLFFMVWSWYLFSTDLIQPNLYAFVFPLLIILSGLQALGFGLIISSMTSKYKDLIFLLSFSIQLWMYATPVIYPLSSVSGNYRWLLNVNPVTPIVEIFRYGFLGKGDFSAGSLLYCAAFTIAIVFAGSIIFNRTEKNFMDTI